MTEFSQNIGSVSQIDDIFNQVLEELRQGDYSIFKKNRKDELEKILELDYRKVPVEFSNFIIKRLVEKKGKNCPLPLLYFCIQNLGYYFLKENGIEDRTVTVDTISGSWGYADESGVVMSKSHVKALRKGEITVLETLFHEINHQIQMKRKREADFSFCTYEWLQDTLLYAFIGDPYYSVNYERVSIERDSRIKGSVLAYQYLKEVSPKTAKKLEKKVFFKVTDEVKKITPNRNVKLLFSTREELFDDLIRNRSSLLEAYPFLRNFYHDDGSKKSLAEVLLDYKGLRDQRKYYEVRYSKEELKQNEDYKEVISKISFYIQFLKNRTSSYENTKNDYLSIATSNIPFLEACSNDDWLESERNYYLTRFEKKYIVLMQLGKMRSSSLGEDILKSINREIDNMEQVCAAKGNLGIVRRTIISAQRIWNLSLREKLLQGIFLEEPIEHLDVDLIQKENNIRK